MKAQIRWGLLLVLVGCGGAPVAAPTPAPTDTLPAFTAAPEPTVFSPISGNPTVPPTEPGSARGLTLADLPILPDVLVVTPGERFSVQVTSAAPQEIEAFYTMALAELGLVLVERQEDVAGVVGRGLLLTYTGEVYVKILPDAPEFAPGTGVVLTLDRDVVMPAD